MSGSNEELGELARAEALREIIEEEEARLGKFVLDDTVETTQLPEFGVPFGAPHDGDIIQ